MRPNCSVASRNFAAVSPSSSFGMICPRHSVLSEHAEMLRILREKDLNAIEPLFKVHLYGGMTRMGGKIYSDEYRIYFNHS